MAAGGRRLGALLTGRVLEAEILEAIDLLASIGSPRGRERRLAEAVVGWAAERWPAADWRVQDVDDRASECAQVAATAGSGPGGLLLYSHLDTSLTGADPFDAAVTGTAAVPLGASVDARTVTGFGLGVAKAPAAAALVAFGRAATRLAESDRPHRVRLLLAARGTHRAPAWADGGAGEPDLVGVERWLADDPRPDAAIVAKGGPAGVLFDEPGAAYVRVRVRAGWGAVMSRRSVRPAGGLIAHAGLIVEAIQHAGQAAAEALAGVAGEDAQAGSCFGLGAIRAGQPTKADLVPAVVEVFGYLVAPGPMDRGRLESTLTAGVVAALGATDLAGADVAVTARVIHAGAATDAHAPVVRVAQAAWAREFARPGPTIRGWTGSTDGVVLRAAGIQTARVGPSRTRPVDAGDAVDLDELLAIARLYEDVAIGLAHGPVIGPVPGT